MKRNEKPWALRVLLTNLVAAGMSVSASLPGTLSHTDGGLIKNIFCPAGAVCALVPLIPSVSTESILVLNVREAVLDDTSQDDMDAPLTPPQSVETDLLHAGYSRIAGPLPDHAAGDGLATQRVCCVWRC